MRGADPTRRRGRHSTRKSSEAIHFRVIVSRLPIPLPHRSGGGPRAGAAAARRSGAVGDARGGWLDPEVGAVQCRALGTGLEAEEEAAPVVGRGECFQVVVHVSSETVRRPEAPSSRGAPTRRYISRTGRANYHPDGENRVPRLTRTNSNCPPSNSSKATAVCGSPSAARARLARPHRHRQGESAADQALHPRRNRTLE